MSETLVPLVTKEDAAALAKQGWRSPSEFCRVFLPGWFPNKMPWFHRGILALRTGKTDFLLDFGPEAWRDEPDAEWTVDDLVKIITNFVVPEDPTKPTERLQPIFKLELTPEGVPLHIVIIEARANQAYALPRGYSKTTLINAANLSDLLYEEEPFILYVSESYPHAERQLITVRRQLEENELVLLVFGDQRPARNDTNKWTDGFIELKNGCKAGAIGSGGSIRGMSKDATRPSRIVVDDFQDAEGVKSQTQRQGDLDWFVGTLMPARMLFGTKQTSVDMVGTILHPEAVLPLLSNDPEWRVVIFGAIDRDGDPLWGWALDLERLERLKASYTRLGKLDQFELEYMSNSEADETAAFPMDKLTVIKREEEWYVAKALTVDPAISLDPKADFFAAAVVGIGPNGRIHLQDFYAQVGVDPQDQVEVIFDMYFAHLAGREPDTIKVGIEAVAYQRALLSMVKAKMFEKSQVWGNRAYFEVIPILHGKTGKLPRVQGLIKPRWRAGHITFEKHWLVLEEQFRLWPNGKRDGPDVVAMGIGLLDPFAPLNMGEDDFEATYGTRVAHSRDLRNLQRFRKAP